MTLWLAGWLAGCLPCTADPDAVPANPRCAMCVNKRIEIVLVTRLCAFSFPLSFPHFPCSPLLFLSLYFSPFNFFSLVLLHFSLLVVSDASRFFSSKLLALVQNFSRDRCFVIALSGLGSLRFPSTVLLRSSFRAFLCCCPPPLSPFPLSE